ncbi:Mov34-domain-containing protein [Sistotremastrum niveocremeum HHB9708]|uniref:Eukaryotic translation initiation factor 3 subunit F n=1 Tax=Sistotremastrum niveocremeum HHB9708 TaxID=1314777 RepID=A0A164NY55_9AGAM|nr:Mov34-domain-containing protein [Sistotremastrum niveocremeum HHB9708]
MPLGSSSSAIYLQTSALGSSANPGRALPTVTVHPVALFSILDHFLRRTDSQDRVIGTLIGTRNENEVEVRNCFAVLHSETSEQVAVDIEYHHSMFELHHRVNPKEVIVGWYSTGSNLNTYSALIQNFYSQETAPHQAVHLAMETGLQEGTQVGVKAYVSSPLGVYPKAENCVFIPIPLELRFREAERSTLDLLTSPHSPLAPLTDLDVLSETLQSVSAMIDRVLAYVRSVLAGEVEGDAAVGRYLLDTLNTSVKGMDSGLNSHLQDTLMVSYLANLVRSQVEVSSRLALVT